MVGGRLIDEALHLDRLEHSLGEVSIQPPMSRAALRFIIGEIIRRNQLHHGIVYIQITRGVAPRDHAFPAPAKPAVVMTARRLKLPDAKVVARGVDVITLPDLRWKRCDIKSVSLLPNVLAKQTAKKKGAYEAWLVDDAGLITEGTSTNAGIVTKKGVLVTRAPGAAILNGVTRRAVLDLARREGIKIEERCFSLKEALSAREAFITSTTNYVMPVVHIDGKPVGNGKPGRIQPQVARGVSRLYGQIGGRQATRAGPRQAGALGPPMTVSLPAPRAILFDWDNTLVDNWGAIHEALNLTLAAMGHPTWTYDETRLRVQRSLRDSFPQMFGERWPEARDLYYQSFSDVHLQTLRPMPGAAELLKELAASGLYLAVVSNKTGKFLRLEARAARMGRPFHPFDRRHRRHQGQARGGTRRSRARR